MTPVVLRPSCSQRAIRTTCNQDYCNVRLVLQKGKLIYHFSFAYLCFSSWIVKPRGGGDNRHLEMTSAWAGCEGSLWGVNASSDSTHGMEHAFKRPEHFSSGFPGDAKSLPAVHGGGHRPLLGRLSGRVTTPSWRSLRWGTRRTRSS